MRFFLVHSVRETVSQIFMLLCWAILIAVFIIFKKYIPAVVIATVFIIYLMELLKLIIVSDKDIRLYYWFKVRVCIPVDEIEELDTKAGDAEQLVIYGSRDLINCLYKPELFRIILKKLDINDESIEELIVTGEDIKKACGDWTLIRENVLLDKLIKKEKYTHRRAINYEKRDLSRQLSHDEGKQ